MSKPDKIDVVIYKRDFRGIALEGLTQLEISSCAAKVDERMKQIAQETNIADSSKLAIRAALEIAAELQRTQNQLESLTPADDKRVDGMIIKLEKAVGVE